AQAEQASLPCGGVGSAIECIFRRGVQPLFHIGHPTDGLGQVGLKLLDKSVFDERPARVRWHWLSLSSTGWRWRTPRGSLFSETEAAGEAIITIFPAILGLQPRGTEAMKPASQGKVRIGGRFQARRRTRSRRGMPCTSP